MRPLRILTLAFLLFTLTAAGYIKRMPVSTYRAQKRGGKEMIFALDELGECMAE